MFTVEERELLRDSLVAAARADRRVTGAALTGSASVGAQDRWSDIDLALGVAGAVDKVIDDWTGLMYREHGAVHHTDVVFRSTLYRVFLLDNTLQVDVAFAPAEEFGALAPTFRLLFGTAQEQPQPAAPDAVALLGMGWLYALHARSSIERGRVWQAEYMISGVRDQVLALACLRHDLPASQGRGVDRLPPSATAVVSGALVRSLETTELRRAFGVVTDALLIEAELVDAELARRLAGPLDELSRSRSAPS
ncbi:nucleotidyltransferase domain-containing protein [Allokutzneria oryzae]|uniref:Nucleotidyltransferase domain-containing protein n=1 Tax=Allokutzneria oryzae TaxID=1378989 RepID=A0ABV5ZRI3_9PSEU